MSRAIFSDSGLYSTKAKRNEDSEKDIAQLENKMLTEVEKHGFNPALGVRAALLIARAYICGTSDTPQTDVLVAIDAALDLPPRNCDVGTVDEQIDRHEEYCASRLGDGNDPHGCMLIACKSCALRWAQMEYKEVE